jgi:large subunit ribosomal protein L29
VAKKKLETMKSFTAKELKQKLLDSQKGLFEGKIKHATGQLENTAQLWKVRKEIARMKTFLTQKGSK